MYFCSMHCYTVCWFDVFTAKFSPRVWGSCCVHHQTGIPTLQVQGWVSISTLSLAAVLFFLFCFDSSSKQCEALPFYVEILPSFAPFYCTVKMDFSAQNYFCQTMPCHLKGDKPMQKLFWMLSVQKSQNKKSTCLF